MTTIVCNREEMAADSLLSGASRAMTTKIHRTKHGIIGAAGHWAECNAFIQWFAKGDENAKPPNMDEVSVLLLTNSGKILCYDGYHIPYELKDKYAAIGSGEYAAMAAMYCGKTPKEAVKIASLVDSLTGGPIKSLKIKTQR